MLKDKKKSFPKIGTFGFGQTMPMPQEKEKFKNKFLNSVYKANL